MLPVLLTLILHQCHLYEETCARYDRQSRHKSIAWSRADLANPQLHDQKINNKCDKPRKC